VPNHLSFKKPYLCFVRGDFSLPPLPEYRRRGALLAGHAPIGLDERPRDARERNAFHRERQHRHQSGYRLP
jgi:hypothetical protein